MTRSTMCRGLRCMALAVLVTYATAAGFMGSPVLDAPAVAQTKGQVPGQSLGGVSDAEFWRQIRHGVAGTVSIPDKQAAVLVQSEGDNWRAMRNGPVSVFGGWVLLAVIVVLAVFFAVRGRIRVDGGSRGEPLNGSTGWNDLPIG